MTGTWSSDSKIFNKFTPLEDGELRDKLISGLNYGMTFILLSYCILPAVSQPLSIFISWHSRRAEYRADRRAVEEGYGAALISSLKKLAKENFSNLSPVPLIVKLAYSHPPLSQRIAAIEREANHRA